MPERVGSPGVGFAEFPQTIADPKNREACDCLCRPDSHSDFFRKNTPGRSLPRPFQRSSQTDSVRIFHSDVPLIRSTWILVDLEHCGHCWTVVPSIKTIVMDGAPQCSHRTRSSSPSFRAVHPPHPGRTPDFTKNSIKNEEGGPPPLPQDPSLPETAKADLLQSALLRRAS